MSTFSDVEMSSTEKSDAQASLMRDELQESLQYSTPRKTSRLTQCFRILTTFSLVCASTVGFLALKQHLTTSPTSISPDDFSMSQSSCVTPMARPEWRSLPEHRRFAYTVAVERLMKLPSRLGLNTSRYDDFTYVHIQVKNQVHHTALSLPWHRLFVSVFEQALTREGKFDGPLPYWDWTLDAADPLISPVWDSRVGFGGNGTAPDNCVTDGVLSSYIAAYTEEGYAPHCVTRKFDSTYKEGAMHGGKWRPEVIKEIIMGAATYEEFRYQLESGPHKQLHLGIGGEMNSISSSNDPIFFIHHAQIDRLWWLWQQQHPSQRNVEFAGPKYEDGEMAATGADVTDRVLMLGLGKDHSVRGLLTTKSDVLCYKYAIDL
ncbi:hypothetical protein LZ554_008773 [Drepanopeziza brunnea f. sp. 'monogermtubi']|nr:hypothetical protein LZ554_008773 [Drepanopeziza brunnea f. sp. 'monogermtubi']